MKKIGVDFLPVENSPAGIGQYTLGLIKALLKIDKTNQYYIYTTKPLGNILGVRTNVKNIVIKWPKSLPLKGMRWMNQVIADLKKKNMDIMISTSNNYFANYFPKTIQFIHDLAPLHFPENYKFNARLLYTYTSKQALFKALQIVTIAQTIKDELIELGNGKAKNNLVDEKKISIISGFMNEEMLSEKAKRFPDPRMEGDFILTISTLEPKKNMLLSIRAFSELIKIKGFEKYKYFIVGKKGWQFENLFEEVKKLGLEDKVIFLGYVPDEFIADIIKRSSCMLLLSKYEGFGITPLESVYFGKPAIVSDIPIFKEILEGYASFVSIEQEDSIETWKTIAQTLAVSIIAGPVDLKDKVIKMYSADKSAKKLLELIEQY